MQRGRVHSPPALEGFAQQPIALTVAPASFSASGLGAGPTACPSGRHTMCQAAMLCCNAARGRRGELAPCEGAPAPCLLVLHACTWGKTDTDTDRHRLSRKTLAGTDGDGGRCIRHVGSGCPQLLRRKVRMRQVALVPQSHILLDSTLFRRHSLPFEWKHIKTLLQHPHLVNLHTQTLLTHNLHPSPNDKARQRKHACDMLKVGGTLI
jgi:hypothetical protein